MNRWKRGLKKCYYKAFEEEMKPKVFITRMIPEEGLKPILDACEATVWPGELPPSKAELCEAVHGVEGLLCLLTDRVDGEVMDAAGPSLRVISVMAAGYDLVDVEAATQRGILVTNTPAALTETTADLAFALLLCAARRIVEARDYVRAGRWKTWGPMLMLGEDVHGATLGIVGMGRIGQAVAKRAMGFGMKVLFYNRSPKTFEGAEACPDLDTLLMRSDFISLHCPATPENRHMIDARALSLMKPNAILINTARGSLVDTGALYEALRTRRIKAAALDVTDPEPLPEDHPLLSLDNCIVVPHIGSASRAARAGIASLAAQNLLAALRGERPPYPVNPEVLERRRGR